MGVVKYTLPLVFPLMFKYVVDVLVMHQPKLEAINALMDRWCSWLALTLGMGSSTTAKLAALAVAGTALFAVQAVATYFADYWAGIAGNRLILELRHRMFQHAQRLSHSFFDRNSSGSLVSRFTNDIQLAQNLVASTLTNIWMDAAALGCVVWMLFLLDARLAAIALCVVPVYVVLIRLASPRIKAVSHEVQDRLAEFSGELEQRMAGAAIVKSFGREEFEAERLHVQATGLHERMVGKVRLVAMQQMGAEFITRVAPLAVICCAALMIVRGRMEVGTVVAFIGFLGYVYQPLEHFSQLSSEVANSVAAIERIFEFLDTRPEIAERPFSIPLRVKRGAIAFDQVSFAYSRPDSKPRQVLRDVNVKIEGGSIVALVGRSGAGKTTMASLIPRFYDVTAGRVLIDGKDVRHLDLKSLRAAIGVVTQDTMLFSTTIRDNLAYGNPQASDADLWEALEQANIADFVATLPDGLDTKIGTRGMKLSGGQRQRLAIARAFLKNPPILILDEATSALDSESESLVHQATRRLMNGRTSIVIAHRLSLAASADMVVVLDNGAVAEIGTHESLLRYGGIYAQLFTEQAQALGVFSETLPAEAAGNMRSLA